MVTACGLSLMVITSAAIVGSLTLQLDSTPRFTKSSLSKGKK